LELKKDMVAKRDNFLPVFKGREANLNHAIFEILAADGSQTIYEVHKRLKKHKGFSTKYAGVNKRVRLLEDKGYVKVTGMVKTKAGFQAATFDLTFRAYLVYLCIRSILNVS
jgi:hypothetical protein